MRCKPEPEAHTEGPAQTNDAPLGMSYVILKNWTPVGQVSELDYIRRGTT